VMKAEAGRVIYFFSFYSQQTFMCQMVILRYWVQAEAWRIGCVSFYGKKPRM
jgi:hypothetical protein